MSELLVRATDRPGRFRRGDVIAACSDGWPWSEAERSNPDWMILTVPGLAAADALALTEESGDGTRRRHALDLDRLDQGPTPAAIRAAMRARAPEQREGI